MPALEQKKDVFIDKQPFTFVFDIKNLEAVPLIFVQASAPNGNCLVQKNAEFNHPLLPGDSLSLQVRCSGLKAGKYSRSILIDFSKSGEPLQEQLQVSGMILVRERLVGDEASIAEVVAERKMCPQSFKEWNNWRTALVTQASDPRDWVDSKKSKLWDICSLDPKQQKFFRNDDFQSCMKSFVDIRKILIAKTSQYVSLFADPYRDPIRPGVNNLPAGLEPFIPQLLDEVNQFKKGSKSKIDAIFASLSVNIKGFFYESQMVGHGAMILVLEGLNEDKFIHLDRDTVLMLTMVKTNAKGKALERPIAYFNQFDREGPKLDQRRFITGRCISCHQTGVMPVVTKKGSAVVSLGKQEIDSKPIDWFNFEMATQNTAPRLRDFELNNMGVPCVGEEYPPERTDAFMQRCISKSGQKLDEKSFKTVKREMNCASCHDGNRVSVVSPLLEPPGFATRPLMENLIHGGIMPLGVDLKPEERVALASCLRAEYYGGFTSESLKGDKEPGTLLRSIVKIPCPVDESEKQKISQRLVKPNTLIRNKSGLTEGTDVYPVK